jgi:hypothetical protein
MIDGKDLLERTYADFVETYHPLEEDREIQFFQNRDKMLAETPINHIWTWINEDGEDFIVSGYRVCNSIGYLITQVPYDESFIVQVTLD